MNLNQHMWYFYKLFQVVMLKKMDFGLKKISRGVFGLKKCNFVTFIRTPLILLAKLWLHFGYIFFD